MSCRRQYCKIPLPGVRAKVIGTNFGGRLRSIIVRKLRIDFNQAASELQRLITFRTSQADQTPDLQVALSSWFGWGCPDGFNSARTHVCALIFYCIGLAFRFNGYFLLHPIVTYSAPSSFFFYNISCLMLVFVLYTFLHAPPSWPRDDREMSEKRAMRKYWFFSLPLTALRQYYCCSYNVY